ncbi:MAG: XisI protein [Okeania sp. SIO2C2]|nr:XisI protein [Okeania sp. SIO2G5]NEP89306.1 XisI protein [Okeania sp. SIO2C2]NEP93124.1 XisI protein [Okeania sp. SIO2F5]NEQ93235.1 XisI protein [Okeania sp. SIO2G4]
MIYITLGEGTVYVEYDGIEQGITQDLIDQGIPQNNIILGHLWEMNAENFREVESNY